MIFSAVIYWQWLGIPEALLIITLSHYHTVSHYTYIIPEISYSIQTMDAYLCESKISDDHFNLFFTGVHVAEVRLKYK